MSRYSHIQKLFNGIGGEFHTPIEKIASALPSIRVFLFDWDGVFNDGMKTGDLGSPFGEADSMGINLLRLSYWLKHRRMPVTGIITGAANEGAEYLAKREGYEFCIRGFTNKKEAFAEFCQQMKVTSDEVAFFFDDVLDLPIAQQAALRFCISRKAGPLFTEYVKARQWCDYLTGCGGGQHALRECCELIMGLAFDHDEAVRVRLEYGEVYQQFLAQRKAVNTFVLKP